LETLVLFWRDDENAPIQVPQAEHSETARPSPAAVDLDECLRVCVTEPLLILEFILSPGERVPDALSDAGGATDDAQSESTNLPLRVQDEGRYHIPGLD